MRWFLVALWLFNSSVVQAGLLNKLKSLGQTLQQQQASPRSQNIDDATFPLSDEPVTGPGGIVARCSDFIKVKNDKEAFNVHRQDWTPEILDFLKNTVDGCAQQKINLQTPNNYDIKVLQIEGESKQMKIYLDGAYSDGIYQKKQQAESNELQAKQLEIDRQKQLAYQCETSIAFKLYDTQERVIENVQILDRIKQLQVRDRLVTKESGVRDLNAERQLGEAVVSEKEQINAYFVQYKQLGGTAKTPQSVTHQIQNNPCE